MMWFMKNRKIDSIISELREGNLEDYHAEQQLNDLDVAQPAIDKILEDAKEEREENQTHKWSELGSRLVREHVLNTTDG